MEILHPKIDAYLQGLPPHDDPVLRKMEAQADQEDFPIVGSQVGPLLMLLARAIGARRVFEMGSGYGYSGLWFAKAMPKDGRVTLTDYSDTRCKEAEAYVNEAGHGSTVRCLVGDGIELIKRERGPFDVIFLDADKKDYPLALKTGLPKLRPGGLFIADNVLWFGQVLDPHPDEDTRGILEFTRLIYRTPGLSSSIIPLRDGVSVSLKT